MIISGNVWKFGDGISTDHIIPGRFYHLRSDLEGLASHAFEDICPGFYNKVRDGDILVAGHNFGLGSSREHAPLVLKLAGIEAVVARSFARIFYRNAINVGLAAIICDMDGVEEGDQMEVRIEEGILIDTTRNIECRFSPLPAMMRDILAEGGLVAYMKRYGGFKLAE
jgi:3-isopropylmalate/(R)-2-methylmalate dehydratase small subunit